MQNLHIKCMLWYGWYDQYSGIRRGRCYSLLVTPLHASVLMGQLIVVCLQAVCVYILTCQVEGDVKVALSVTQPSSQWRPGEQSDGHGDHEESSAASQTFVPHLTPAHHRHERAPEPCVQTQHDGVADLTSLVLEQLREQALACK